MAITQADLDTLFKHHPPTREAGAHHDAIRVAAKVFAATVLEHTPPSADQTAAIRKIREAVFTANAAIALDGRF